MTSIDKNKKTEGATGRALCSVTCPMCGFAHKQYRLNPRKFWNQSTALDRQPTDFQCLKELGDVHPPLYELWHCPQCHYTASNRVFPDPLKNVYVEKSMIERKWEEARTDPHGARVCDSLGAGLPQDDITFPDAIRMAYLSVYFSRFLVSVLDRGHASLAKEYLRLGWLYRDWGNMQEAAERTQAEQDLSALVESLREAWPEIPAGETDALQQACQAFEAALEEPALQQEEFTKASIMQHMGRIYLQMDMKAEASRSFQASRRVAFDEEAALKRLLQQDDRTKSMDPDTRSKNVSLIHRLRQCIEENQDMLDKIKGASRPASGSGAQKASAPPAKKGFLKGLFGG